MVKKLIVTCASVFLVFLSFVSPASARVGVGVTTGKIQVDERLMAGVIYKLPVFQVINTGDEASDYSVSIEFRENQEEMRTSSEWFKFEPSNFYLEPGDAQAVTVELVLPLDVIPGDYFCFISGHPDLDKQSGVTQIGISAASKLYFTVAPSNIFEGIYYRVLSLWVKYQPWTNIGGAVVLAVIILYILSRFIKIEIRVKKDKKNE